MTEHGPVDPDAAREATRRKGIGGSDAPAILGLSPWRSPMDVWAEKLNLVPKQDESFAMKMGKLMEPIISALYTERTGRRLKKPYPQIVRHAKHEWLLASIDRLVMNPGVKDPAFVELKTSRWDRGWGDEGGPNVPDDYYVQVQHYLAVMGGQRVIAVKGPPLADCACLIGGADYRIYSIERDDNFIAEMLPILEAFWFNYVQTGNPPPVDGSEACRNALQARYPKDAGIEVTATPEHQLMVEDLREARALYDEAEGRKRECENRIKAAMGDASTLVGDGWKVTWKTTKNQDVVDWQRVAEALNDGKVPHEILLPHTVVRPGGRRFLLTEESK